MSNQLYEDIPSLKNKAIIDLVNIVSNNKDIIAEREDRGFLGEILAKLTGRNQKELNLILKNMNQQMDSVSELLNFISDSLQENTNTMNIISNELIDMKLELIDFSNKIQKRFNQLEEKIDYVKFIQEVNTEIDNEFNKLELNKFKEFSPIEQLKIVLENLYYGKTGLFIKECKETSEIEKVKNKIKVKLKRYFDKNYNNRIIYLFELINKNINQREETKFLFDYKGVFSEILQIASGREDGYNLLLSERKNDDYLKIPFLFSKEELPELLLNEILR